MEQILNVGGLSIKASPAIDKKGRKGYFISQRNLKDIKATVSTKKTKPTSIRPEVEQSLKEMRDYKDGKLKPRSIDEVLQSI
jgi:hypothetical protein